MIVTHPKIRSLTPQWQEFHGYSLIFEARGETGAPGAATFTDHPANLAGFAAIGRALEEVGQDALMRGLLLCLVPVESYHVTVADLINPSDARHARPAAREAIARAIVPEAITAGGPLPGLLGDMGLTAGVNTRHPVRLRAGALDMAGGRAALLRMEPATEQDAAALQTLGDWRAGVMARLEQATGQPPRPWSPHITLGYFANPRLAGETPALAEALQDRLKTALANVVFEFDAVTLYGFSSMVAYWRTA